MQLFSVLEFLCKIDISNISHGYVSYWNSQRDISSQVSFSKRYQVEHFNSHNTNR